MTTSIATATAWFYNRDSTTLYVNEDTHRVGINNSAPQYDLQVDGTIYARNNILKLTIVRNE